MYLQIYVFQLQYAQLRVTPQKVNKISPSQRKKTKGE